MRLFVLFRSQFSLENRGILGLGASSQLKRKAMPFLGRVREWGCSETTPFSWKPLKKNPSTSDRPVRAQRARLQREVSAMLLAAAILQ